MKQVEFTRSELQRVFRSVPFHQFVVSLESGERALIEHPENVAFDPEPNGREEVHIISRTIRLFTTLSAISGIYLADRDGAAA